MYTTCIQRVYNVYTKCTIRVQYIFIMNVQHECTYIRVIFMYSKILQVVVPTCKLPSHICLTFDYFQEDEHVHSLLLFLGGCPGNRVDDY